MGKGTRRACRGGRRQRARKDQLRKPGRPIVVGSSLSSQDRKGDANGRRESITVGRRRVGVGQVHSSGEAGNDRGAKGPDWK